MEMRYLIELSDPQMTQMDADICEYLRHLRIRSECRRESA
jgi:hypothetical protein